MPTLPSDLPTVQPGNYEIRIRERIEARWLAWFDEYQVTLTRTGETRLIGLIPDQSALHGLLAKIRDLNLTLLSVNRLPDRPSSGPRVLRIVAALVSILRASLHLDRKHEK